VKCESEGNYLEAARASDQLDTLRKQVCGSLRGVLRVTVATLVLFVQCSGRKTAEQGVTGPPPVRATGNSDRA
jgi:hypothetical protein